MVVVSKPVDDKVDSEIESLKDQFEELKSRMSELRKKGKDTELAEIMAMDFPARIILAKATYDRDELDQMRVVLLDLRKELDDIERGSAFEHANEHIREAYESLRQNEPGRARESYSKIMDIYKDLPKEEKHLVYIACLEIKDRIEGKGSKDKGLESKEIDKEIDKADTGRESTSAEHKQAV